MGEPSKNNALAALREQVRDLIQRMCLLEKDIAAQMDTPSVARPAGGKVTTRKGKTMQIKRRARKEAS